MGVPVITLAARYVSRMTTAVLSGAQLPEWIVYQKRIISIKRCAPEQHLRQSREQLRRHLQASPLGDAAGLNSALSLAWRAMVEKSLRVSQ